MSALVDRHLLEAPGSFECEAPRVTLHTTSEIRTWLRTDRTIWCPGCSNGIVTRALIDALLNLEVDRQKVVVVAGIGCSGRVSQYLDCSTVHTAHGRALALATGVKAADPELRVIVVMGDGDCTAIGGNHLIHAARRNVAVTALVFNNSIYGMTGGQTSPTTHLGGYSTTTTYGNAEPAFDICELAHAAGATYVARGTPYAYKQLVQLIAGGIKHPGFSLVEAMSVCPVYYGRFNLTADAGEFLKLQKEHAVPADQFGEGESRARDRYPVGVLHHAERAGLIDGLAELRRKAQGGDHA